MNKSIWIFQALRAVNVTQQSEEFLSHHQPQIILSRARKTI